MRKMHVRDGLLGVCVGDALGVPVEFFNRSKLEADPVVDMRSFGTHNQPQGTWSDDSSLTFCLAESLCLEFSLSDLAKRFCDWMSHGYWTPHNGVFDYGQTTYYALQNLANGIAPVMAGGRSERSNGNGSLMRILPMVYCFPEQAERIKMVQDVSCLTHAHARSQLACVIYIEFAKLLLDGMSPKDAYQKTQSIVTQHYTNVDYTTEYRHLNRVLYENIYELPKEQISSSGYVVHTLEAALWCLFRHDNYKDTVLEAVNLGGDTDTVAAVAGGLAGILYGWESIPEEWIKQTARIEEIFALADKLQISQKKETRH